MDVVTPHLRRALLPEWAAWLLVLGLGLTANVLNNKVATHWYLVTSLGVSTLLLVVARRANLSWRDLGLARGTWRVGALWALTIIAVVASAYAIAVMVPMTRGLFVDHRAETGSLGELAFQVFLRIPFGTVVLEEVLFRGVLLALAARSVGWWRGAVVSSLLFGLWHILPAQLAARSSPAIEDVANAGGGGHLGVAVAVAASVLATAAAGMIFCWLRIKSGSLFSSMGLHWATNGLGYFFAALVMGGW